MEQDLLLLTPAEEEQVEKKLRQSYLKALKAFESSQEFTPEPHLPTLEEMVKAKLQAQLAKALKGKEAEIERERKHASDVVLIAAEQANTQRDIIWIKALMRGGIAVSEPSQLGGISEKIRNEERKGIERRFMGTIKLLLPTMLEEASNKGKTTEEMTAILERRIETEFTNALKEGKRAQGKS